MAQVHVFVFSRMQRSYFFAPQLAGFHDVGFFAGGDFVVTLAGEFEGHARDTMDFMRGIDLRIDALTFAIGQRCDAARLAKVNAAGQFAHDQDIEAFDDTGFQRGGIDKCIKYFCRAQVGEEFQFLAQLQQACFGADAVINFVPFRSANGSK